MLAGTCPPCRLAPPPYAGAISTTLYTGNARELVLLLKFSGVRTLADFWAARLAKTVSAQPWTFDLVVPVPLGPRRHRRRGFNQSALIAAALARRLKVRSCSSALLRRRETDPQTGLLAAERERNLAGAFRAAPPHLRGHSVLLVDDVLTTGATARAAAAALGHAGAGNVYVATAARADLERELQLEACA